MICCSLVFFEFDGVLVFSFNFVILVLIEYEVFYFFFPIVFSQVGLYWRIFG